MLSILLINSLKSESPKTLNYLKLDDYSNLRPALTLKVPSSNFMLSLFQLSLYAMNAFISHAVIVTKYLMNTH